MMVTDLIHRGTPWTAIMLDHGPRAARLNVRGTHMLAVAALSTGLLAGVLGRRRLAASLMTGYLGLNTQFYGLIFRTAGARAAGAAVLLLAAHNATAMGSVPLGFVRFAYEHARQPDPQSTPIATYESSETAARQRPSARWHRSGRTHRVAA